VWAWQRAIAEIMSWEDEHVARIIRRYVGRSAATQAIIRQINEARGRTQVARPAKTGPSRPPPNRR